jgi:hypothetical protein
MTAVEWLIDRTEDVDLNAELWEQIKFQALKMEKQQIIEAHGLIAKLQEDGSHKLISGETYYDETYKSTNK